LAWTVNGVVGGNATLGTISASGLYTAPEFPPAANTITISATDTVNSNKPASEPNVGPFVATQLIKKLVTSNPSPAYVQRVAQAFNTGTFNTYGSVTRGDMQATVAAILLDPEARRGDVATTVVATDGKLREPVVMIASMARAFHAKTDAAGLSYEGDAMSENIFFPPTVFNFFPPVNPVAGTTLNGPEFAMFDTTRSLSRVNFIDDAVYGMIGGNTQLDFSPVINAGTPDQMVAWLDTLFLHGTRPDEADHFDGRERSGFDRYERAGAGRHLPVHFLFDVPGAALER
jgi:hypothetical protein